MAARTAIRDYINNNIRTNGKTKIFTINSHSVITPDDVRDHVTGTGYEYVVIDVRYGNNLTLRGDFSKSPLRAVLHGSGTLQLGDNLGAFTSVRSNNEHTLLIYSETWHSPRLIDYTRGGQISNARIAVNEGDIVGSSDEVIINDAQIFANNINIGTVLTPLIMPNWNPKYVPTIIAGQMINVNVIADNGFSGIFSGGVAVGGGGGGTNLNVTAPTFNGAFLHVGNGGAANARLTHPLGHDVRITGNIKGNALNNLQHHIPDIWDYFYDMIEDGEGDLRGDAEFIDDDLTINTTSVTLREVTGS